MAATIRKTLLHVETTLIEGGRQAPTPLRLIAAMAVVKNPWAGRGFVEDLKPEIHAVAPVLGELLTGMIIETAGSGDAVEAYGKAAVVSLDGEVRLVRDSTAHEAMKDHEFSAYVTKAMAYMTEKLGFDVTARYEAIKAQTRQRRAAA